MINAVTMYLSGNYLLAYNHIENLLAYLIMIRKPLPSISVICLFKENK